MKKWTALGSNNEEPRWQALSRLMNEKGVANDYVPWTGAAPDELTDLAPLEMFDHCRLSSGVSMNVVKHVKVQSSWTTLLGVVDGMNKTPLGWWPLCALYESFGPLLIDLGQELDTRGNVVIAGAGGTARIAIAAFFKAGFQNFLVTNIDSNEALKLIKEVKSRFFGMNIQMVPLEGIVLLPGESSVLVNCTPSVEDNPLLTELSYLNFLRRPGFLFDLSRSFKPSILMQEAKDAGVRTVSGVELAARTDALWAKWAFHMELDTAVYQDRLRATLSVPVK